MFSSIRSNKASDLIVSQIRNQILAGKLVPGDRLPVERTLMEQFNVSKQTMREALRVLEFLGLVEIKKGMTGGACIAEIDSQTAMDILANFLYFKNLSIQNLAEVRKVLEPHAAAVAAKTMPKGDIARLERLIERSREQYTAGRFEEERFKNELDFHSVIANSTKNPLLALIVEFVESLMSEQKAMIKLNQAFLASVIAAHERIYDAILGRDAERAREEMYRHIVEVEQKMEKLERKADNEIKMKWF